MCRIERYFALPKMRTMKEVSNTAPPTSTEQQLQTIIAHHSAQGLKPSIILMGKDRIREYWKEHAPKHITNASDGFAHYGFAGCHITIHEVDNKDRNFLAVY